MADNYLEKKFEEHLNAPYKAAKPRRAPVKERRAVVLHGDSPIGAAVVKSLRVAGHKVAFCDTDGDAGREIALRTGADYFCADPTKADELAGFLKDVLNKWGGVDIIVIAFPLPNTKRLLDSSVESLDSGVQSFVRPLVTCAQFMSLSRRDDGHVNDVKSCQSQYGRLVSICPPIPIGDESSPMWALANSIVVSLTQSLSSEMSSYGVTVNCISPGYVRDESADAEQEAPLNPSFRIGQPSDVARVVRFLIDETSYFISAENIVAGGCLSRK